ncbi:MAG: hypothetical protein ABIE47_13120 [Pseudomonadota bacterium]
MTKKEVSRRERLLRMVLEMPEDKEAMLEEYLDQLGAKRKKDA